MTGSSPVAFPSDLGSFLARIVFHLFLLFFLLLHFCFFAFHGVFWFRLSLFAFFFSFLSFFSWDLPSLNLVFLYIITNWLLHFRLVQPSFYLVFLDLVSPSSAYGWLVFQNFT